MDQIQLISVGRLKGNAGYLSTGIEEYLKRLQPYVKISGLEIPDEAISATKTTQQILDREGERLLAYMERASYTLVLSERGQSLTSEQFARQWEERDPLNGGISSRAPGPMIVIIGGALGVSQAVIQRADWVVSLSPMTFPHPMVRLIFLEQLYRIFKILRNEPYHK